MSAAPTPIPGHDDCIFCKLIAGEIPSARVLGDDLTIAFMDIGQLNPGHTLVALKRHAATLLDLNKDEASAIMRSAYRVAKAVNKAFHPPGLNLFQANGREGDQTVFHFHMHVVPRHADDGVAIAWPRRNPSAEMLADYAAQLRQVLER